jgi:hypothetical protein
MPNVIGQLHPGLPDKDLQPSHPLFGLPVGQLVGRTVLLGWLVVVGGRWCVVGACVGWLVGSYMLVYSV